MILRLYSTSTTTTIVTTAERNSIQKKSSVSKRSPGSELNILCDNGIRYMITSFLGFLFDIPSNLCCNRPYENTGADTENA